MADATGAGLDLTGKAVVVTGAGQGLGEAVAKAVAAAGAAVVVNDLAQDVAQRCVDAITAAGGKAVAHAADITVWAQAEGLIERCIAEYGKIDGLVNNAGVHFPTRSWEMEEKSVRKQLDVNIIGTLATANRALKAMRAQGFGSIVNTTSGAHMGLAWRPDYGASKGAVSSFTYTAALELQQEGSAVRVNCMSPNAWTPMVVDTEKFMMGQGLGAHAGLPPPETNVAIHLYLLSDRAQGVSGQIMGIRGDGELYIAAHPAMLEPTMTRKDWTPLAIAEAMETGGLAPPQPVGVQRVRHAAPAASPQRSNQS